MNPDVQQSITDIFAALRSEYPDIAWNLFLNEDFTEQVLRPTLGKASVVADTSELFIRSWKLLNVVGVLDVPKAHPKPKKYDTSGDVPEPLARNTDVWDARNPKTRVGIAVSRRGELQPIVRNLMKTLLEDHPTLLDETDLRNLMNSDYCKNRLGLQLSNLALLRRVESGRAISGRDRYYKDLYSDQFYVCSQWWKAYHLDNARSLLRFVTELSQSNPEHLGAPALERHAEVLRDYIG